MKEFAERLVPIEAEISKERGPLWLFALLLRADAPDRWDLLVSASWTSEDKGETLRYIISKLKASGPVRKQIFKLARIIIIDEKSPVLAAINQLGTEQNLVEIQDCTFSGVRIKRGFIITSRPPLQRRPSKGAVARRLRTRKKLISAHKKRRLRGILPAPSPLRKVTE